MNPAGDQPAALAEAAAANERELLGCGIANPAALPDLLATIPDAAWHLQAHVTLWGAMRRQIAASADVSTLSVLNALKTRPELPALRDELLACLELACPVANWRPRANRLLDRHRARQARKVGLALVEGQTTPDEAVAALQGLLVPSAAIQHKPWAEVAAMTEELPESIMGSRLITRGSLVLLAGKPGAGKSYLLCHLLGCAGTGTSWLKLEPPPRPMRCGYIGPEVPAWLLAPWLRGLSVNGSSPLVSFCVPPWLEPSFDMLEHESLVVRWVRALELDMLALDPLGMLQRLDLNEAKAAGLIMASCRRICLSTNAAVIVAHHPRKSQPGSSGKTEPIDDPAGSYRLEADPDVVLILSEQAGLIKLATVKNRLGPRLEPIWVKRIQDGIPEVVQPPALSSKHVGETNRQRVAEYRVNHPGTTQAKTAEELGLALRTVKGHWCKVQDGASNELALETTD